MKTLERQTKSKKQIGRFSTLEEASTYKVNLTNEMLAKVKNWNDFLNSDSSPK